MADVDNTAELNGEAGQETGKEFVPPTDGSWVPRDRLNAETDKRKALEGNVEELRQEVAGLKQPQVKVYSEQELQSYVDAGQITDAQMQKQLRQQDNATTRTSLKSEITAEIRAEAKDEKLSAQISAYTRKVPDLDVDGTEAASRVEKVYKFNTNECGMPKGRGAMLAALRQVYGPAETLQLKGQPVVETYSETGGGSGASPPPNSEGKPKGLSAREDAYYSSKVGTALYPTWKDVEKELSFANPNVRSRPR